MDTLSVNYVPPISHHTLLSSWVLVPTDKPLETLIKTLVNPE